MWQIKVVNLKGLNCVIPRHLFASHRTTKVPIVLYLVLQSILTDVNEVVRSGRGILQLLLQKISEAKKKTVWKSHVIEKLKPRS